MNLSAVSSLASVHAEATHHPPNPDPQAWAFSTLTIRAEATRQFAACSRAMVNVMSSSQTCFPGNFYAKFLINAVHDVSQRILHKYLINGSPTFPT